MSTMEFYYTEYSDLNDYNAENTVYKITDEELLKSLTSAYNSNYFGYDYCIDFRSGSVGNTRFGNYFSC